MQEQPPRLVPVIAAYSGETARAIRAALGNDALRLVARAARGPMPASGVGPAETADLIAMRVLTACDGLVRLATTVFLRNDLERVNAAARAYGHNLAERVAPYAASFADASSMPPASPATLNLLVAILAIGQSLGHALRDAGISDDWQHAGGRYAGGKVDFDEDCPARTALGPDMQNKNVVRGTRYTAVRIGPEASTVSADDPPVDTLGEWLAGGAGASGCAPAAWQDGRRCGLLSASDFPVYLPALRTIAAESVAAYREALPGLVNLLEGTTSGRQGVAPARMAMHLWRYLRRAVARELYARGVLTDAVPETGVITVVYESGCEAIEALL